MPKRKPCITHKRWRFKKTKMGLKRTCRSCGYSVTEVAQGVFGNPVQPAKGRYHRKKDQVND